MNDGQGQAVSLPIDLFLASYEVLVRTLLENLNMKRMILEVRNGQREVASEGDSSDGEEGN
ncbi:MAG: hypothetical protein QXZ09_08605 [Candidatus Methanomethylicaceae archaeon]